MSVDAMPPPHRSRRWRTLRLRVARLAMLALGWVLIVVGVIFALLPGHLGVPVLIIGLILVLRLSMRARRSFISLQRRHPRIVFPIRRLLRREPEVFPVAWQAALRTERLILPRKWRPLRRLRRRIFGTPRSRPRGG